MSSSEKDVTVLLRELASLPTEQLAAQPVHLNAIFTGLVSSDALASMVAKQALNTVMDRPDSALLVSSGAIGPFLMNGLNSNMIAVVVATLEQITSFVRKSEEVTTLLLQEEKFADLYGIALTLLQDEELSISKVASQFFVAICSYKIGVQRVFTHSELGDALNAIRDEDSTLWFRILATVVDIAVSSELAFAAFATQNDVLITIEELFTKSDDFLLQLNAFELIGTLGSVKPGLLLLSERKYDYIITTLIKSSQDDPLMKSLLFPGLLKLLHRLFDHSVQFQVYDLFTTSLTQHDLFEFLRTCLYTSYANVQDPNVLTAAVLAVAGIASHQKGLELLSQMPSSSNSSSNSVSEEDGNILLMLAGSALDEDTLHAIARVLTPVYLEKGSNDDQKHYPLATIQQSMFSQMGVKHRKNTLTVLLELAKQPFEEMICATLAVVVAIAGHLWGSILFSKHKDFLEYLLDKRPSHTSLVLQWKFKIIEQLYKYFHAQPAKFTHVPTEVRDEVERYQAGGPYYTKYESQVMQPEAKTG